MSSVNSEKKPNPSDSQASVDLGEESDEPDESDDEYDSKEDRIWHETRRPVQLQPDPFEDSADFYQPCEDVRLSEKFKKEGLQIIVKMASIELTPEKPDFPVGGWHVSYQCSIGNALLTPSLSIVYSYMHYISSCTPYCMKPDITLTGRRTNERTHLRHRTLLS